MRGGGASRRGYSLGKAGNSRIGGPTHGKRYNNGRDRRKLAGQGLITRMPHIASSNAVKSTVQTKLIRVLTGSAHENGSQNSGRPCQVAADRRPCLGD